METFLWPKAGYESAAIKDDISVFLERLAADKVRFRYVVTGRIDELVIPAAAPPLRANNLWKSTCFEAFLAPVEGEAYRELNFCPSTQWAAYDFSAYRTGMVQASLPAPPDIQVERTSERLDVTVTLSIDLPEESYCVGLAAVIEERGGMKSYWAHNHPSGDPDFHRRDCFDLQLPPPKPE